MNAFVLFWLVVVVVTALMELATVGLTSIWMTGGALAALLAAGLGWPVWLQVLLFLAVTAVLLIFTRPLA